MIKTSVPASHNGLLVYGAAAPASTAIRCCFPADDHCWFDMCSWPGLKDVSSASGQLSAGADKVLANFGQATLNTSQAAKDTTASFDKIGTLLPFLVLMLAFGLAIGWSKGHVNVIGTK